MGRPITNITILGGGTAGWITAAYLNQRLQWGESARNNVRITVIESPTIGVIGVGESTVPTLKGTMQILGISEPEFIQRVDATLKLGIWFDRWNTNKNGDLIPYLHPFTGGKTVRGYNPGYSFKQYGLPDRDETTDQDFVRTIAATREAVENLQGPRAMNGPHYKGALQYAYHIDAAKLAAFLCEVCKLRGVNHVRDDMVDVNLDERGYISSLKLKETGDWPVELVIDCTGFRGLLINKALGEPFESYNDYLLNDRAIPMQVRHADPSRIVPVTGAIAMEAGWVWHIPLHSRVGTGYVFCSAFKSDDDAMAEFRQQLGHVADGIDPMRVIKMRVGRNRRSWVKNCIAVGLSSGFLEPLESTAIMTLELQARWILSNLPTSDFEEPLANQYNRLVANLYDEIRDFLGLHFSLNERKEPFWQAVKHEAKKSDTLQANLELWKHTLPSPSDFRSKTVYNHWSVACILMGKNYYKNSDLAGSEVVTPKMWNQYLKEITEWKRPILGRLANHNALVEHMRAQAVAGESVIRKPMNEPLLTELDTLAAPQPIMAQSFA